MIARLPSRLPSAQRGFSLVELMIGLVIGLVVVGAGVMVYASNRATTDAVAEQNRMEETSRFLLKLSQTSFNAAGFFGCQTRGGIIQNNITTPGFLFNFTQPTFAYESNGSSWVNGPLDGSLTSATPTPSAALNSDILAIRTATGPILPLDTSHAAPGPTGDIWVQANNYLGTTTANAAAMITNCSRTTAFMNTGGTACSNATSCQLQHAVSGTPSPGNNTVNLGFDYNFDAEVVIPATISYYVATSSRCLASAGGTCPSYSLYRQVGANTAEELAENVQAMKVKLLIDPGTGLGSGSQRVSPSSVANWSQVVGVSVDFLITSSKPILPQAKSTTFNGSTYTDKMSRRVVTVTTSVRNSLP